MFNVSYAAGECLGQVLTEANTPDRAAVRLTIEDFDVNLKIDAARSGDKMFDHRGKVVLVIEEQTLELLTEIQLVVQVEGEESRLVLAEQSEDSLS